MVKKKKDRSHCGKTLFAILKYPMVSVDMCFVVMVPAFLQVLAEFHNKALQYINCRAQNACYPGHEHLVGVCIVFTSIMRHGFKWLMANL